MTYVVNYAFAILTAALLIFLFPNFNWTWLAPIALTPILIACARESSWKQRFLFGWASGFAFWFGVCNWIQFVLEVHGGMGRWGGWGTFVLFAAIKGLHMAIFAALAGVLMRTAWAIPMVAALWAGLERTHGMAGFTWLDLGNAGIDMPWLMRLAPFTGVYGLSFVFAMIACAMAIVILRRPRRQLAGILALLLVLILPAAPVAEQGKRARADRATESRYGDAVDDGVDGGGRTAARDIFANDAFTVHHLARSSRAVLSRRS